MPTKAGLDGNQVAKNKRAPGLVENNQNELKTDERRDGKMVP